MGEGGCLRVNVLIPILIPSFSVLSMFLINLNTLRYNLCIPHVPVHSISIAQSYPFRDNAVPTGRWDKWGGLEGSEKRRGMQGGKGKKDKKAK